MNSPTLAWTPSLALDHPAIDATHGEFVEMLARCDAALEGEPAALLAHWQALIDHTVEHFAQEERWMQACGFAVDNCHTYHHQTVLTIMRDVAQRASAEAVDFEPLKRAVGELAIWFPQHAATMDAGLVDVMRTVGYDTVTGERSLPPQPAAAAVTHCGSADCA